MKVNLITNFKTPFVFLAALIISSVFPFNTHGKDAPLAKKGILDLRKWDFSKQKAINLAGEWEFYWEENLNLEDIKSGKENKNYRHFPKLWQHDTIDNQIVTPTGSATHRLRVILSSVTPELSIAIPQMYNSYLLFINGDFVASNGQVGTSKESSVPHWQPAIAG